MKEIIAGKLLLQLPLTKQELCYYLLFMATDKEVKRIFQKVVAFGEK